MLTLSGSTLGWEVYLAVSQKLRPKKGGKVILYYLDSRIMLQQTLHDHRIVGKAMTLSCICVPTDLHATWRCIIGLSTPENQLYWRGSRRWGGITEMQHLQHQLSKSLEHLIFGDRFNQSLEQETLTFGCDFNLGLERVALPCPAKLC